jgi:hypothetical protein
MCVPIAPCRWARVSPTINGMSVAAPEALTYTDSPPETAGYRNLYIMLLVCGFILRFGFVLWKKTYIGSPNDNLPFGAEICSIADHIVRGQGFSSRFHQDTGPPAWVARLIHI